MIRLFPLSGVGVHAQSHRHYQSSLYSQIGIYVGKANTAQTRLLPLVSQEFHLETQALPLAAVLRDLLVGVMLLKVFSAICHL